MIAAKTPLLRVIRLSELPLYTGLKRSMIDALIRRGEFPAPVKLTEGGRAKAWFEHEISAWQQSRIAKRDDQLAETKRR